MTCISTDSLRNDQITPSDALSGLSLVSYTTKKRHERVSLIAAQNVIVYILSGSKIIHFAQESVTLRQHDLIIIEKGRYIMSQIRDDAPEFKSMIIIVDDEKISRFKAGARIPQSRPYHKVSCSTYLKNEMENIDHLTIEEPQDFNRIIESKVDHVFHYLLSTDEGFRDFLLTLQAPRSEPSLLDILLPHVDSFRTVDHMAEKCHMSTSAFHRHFSRSTGQTPHHWLNEKKLELSVKYLMNEALTVTDVAFLAGFENFANFIRVFSKKYGLPPGRYRSKFCRNLQTS